MIHSSAVDFLRLLPPAARESLLRHAQTITYPAGAEVSKAGEPPRLGVVTGGLARNYVVAPDGREATIRYLRPGEPVGLVSMLAREPTLNLRAVAELSILYFEPGKLEQLMATDTRVARIVAEQLARWMAKVSATFLAFVFGSVRQRLATHLLELASAATSEGRPFAPVSHQELANAIGSVRDVVARELGEMRVEGLVTTSRRRVVIADLEALRRAATLG